MWSADCVEHGKYYQSIAMSQLTVLLKILQQKLCTI